MALADSYLDRDGFKARTIAPASLVDGLHIPADKTAERNAWITFVESRLKIGTADINVLLRKRYDCPFTNPNEKVLGWLTDLVTPLLYRRRGVDPSDEQIVSLDAAADRARAEMKEAADCAEGLYDLPLRQDTTAEGISKGGPFGYSEPSPYDWWDRQREAMGE